MGGRAGRSGRRPLSDEVRAERGTLRADRLRPNAPVYGEPTSTCPDWLPPYAKATWRRMFPLLVRARVLKECDREVLAAYCLAWSTLRDAQADVKRLGLVVQGKSGIVRNPASIVAAKAADQLRQYAAELGITPTTRPRVHVPTPLKGDDDAKKAQRKALVASFVPRGAA